MTPVIYTANIYTPPPTLVGATIPGNNTLRVNPVNVPPPVSNTEVANNSKGGAGVIPANAPAASQAATAGSFFLSPFIYTTPTSLSAGAQNTFFAQLLSQDSSTAATGVLAEYEQLVAISQVKYKPSNATLPEPEPSSLFGKILQQERQVQSVQAVVQQATQQTAATQTTATNLFAASVPKATGAPVKTEAPAKIASTAKASAESMTVPRAAIHAYLAVIARNNSLDKTPAEEPVSAV